MHVHTDRRMPSPTISLPTSSVGIFLLTLPHLPSCWTHPSPSLTLLSRCWPGLVHTASAVRCVQHASVRRPYRQTVDCPQEGLAPSWLHQTMLKYTMMIYDTENGSRIIGRLWGESTGHSCGYTIQRASKAEIWCFLCCWPEQVGQDAYIPSKRFNM